MPSTQEEIFIRLIQQHTGIIFKVIHLYVEDAQDQQDLHQEILLQAWKSYPKFKGQAAFSTWLYRVSLNTVLTFNKKAIHHKTVPVQDCLVVENTAQKQETAELLYQLVRQLNDVDKMIMTLHLEGYKNKEIAEITGLKVNHINVKLYRLKNQIIEALKKEQHGLA